MKAQHVLIIILLAAAAIGIIYFQPRQNRAPPDENLCNKTETGWYCVSMNESAEAKFKTVCESQGGIWKCYGECLPFYEHYCDFPFDDAGKECVNSQQCKGKCIVDFEYVQQNYPDRIPYENFTCMAECEGRCAEYPLRMCDWWFELNNGIIEDHTGILCD